jgi:hypothetical protein
MDSTDLLFYTGQGTIRVYAIESGECIQKNEYECPIGLPIQNTCYGKPWFATLFGVYGQNVPFIISQNTHTNQLSMQRAEGIHSILWKHSFHGIDTFYVLSFVERSIYIQELIPGSTRLTVVPTPQHKRTYLSWKGGPFCTWNNQLCIRMAKGLSKNTLGLYNIEKNEWKTNLSADFPIHAMFSVQDDLYIIGLNDHHSAIQIRKCVPETFIWTKEASYSIRAIDISSCTLCRNIVYFAIQTSTYTYSIGSYNISSQTIEIHDTHQLHRNRFHLMERNGSIFTDCPFGIWDVETHCLHILPVRVGEHDGRIG